jgi:nucleoside-triphosphatase THEP1
MKVQYSGKTVEIKRSGDRYEFIVSDIKSNSITGWRSSKAAAVKAGQYYADRGW